jgi:hypothetical protein
LPQESQNFALVSKTANLMALIIRFRFRQKSFKIKRSFLENVQEFNIFAIVIIETKYIRTHFIKKYGVELFTLSKYLLLLRLVCKNKYQPILLDKVNIMNIINLRKNLRRSTVTRRISDRRIVNFEFGSPEWVENIKKNYLAWPKTNRRTMERRADDRRSPDRRDHQASERSRSEKKYSRILLTSEERKLIEDLYLSDIE